MFLLLEILSGQLALGIFLEETLVKSVGRTLARAENIHRGVGYIFADHAIAAVGR